MNDIHNMVFRYDIRSNNVWNKASKLKINSHKYSHKYNWNVFTCIQYESLLYYSQFEHDTTVKLFTQLQKYYI